MKLKYQRLSKDEQEAIKAEFLKNEKRSAIYRKSHKVFSTAIVGIIIATISTTFDIVHKTGIANYLLDGFLLVFSLIFIFVMNNIKLKEINKYVIDKKKKADK